MKISTEFLNKIICGDCIKEMKKLPGALFIIDPTKEHIAVKEAKKLGLPIIAVVDTNCNPDEVDYVIPGNDDAMRAIRFYCKTIADVIIESRRSILEEEASIEKEKAERKAKPKKSAETKIPEVKTAKKVAMKQKEAEAPAQSSEETQEAQKKVGAQTNGEAQEAQKEVGAPATSSANDITESSEEK